MTKVISSLSLHLLATMKHMPYTPHGKDHLAEMKAASVKTKVSVLARNCPMSLTTHKKQNLLSVMRTTWILPLFYPMLTAAYPDYCPSPIQTMFPLGLYSKCWPTDTVRSMVENTNSWNGHCGTHPKAETGGSWRLTWSRKSDISSNR